jgi:hypothetical protein
MSWLDRFLDCYEAKDDVIGGAEAPFMYDLCGGSKAKPWSKEIRDFEMIFMAKKEMIGSSQALLIREMYDISTGVGGGLRR